MRWTKMLAICLAILLVVSVPMQAQASNVNLLSFEMCTNGVSVCECDKSISGQLTIPSSVQGFPVTEIGQSVFEGCTGLASVTIPSSVKTIYNWAFSDCTNLTSVTLQNGLVSIGNGAFLGCEKLTGITIPDTVTKIGNNAFGSCSALTAFQVSGNNKNFSADSKGVLFNKNKTQLIQAPAKLSGSYTVPSTVTEFGESAFSGCSGLTSLIIPEGATTLTWFQFCGCTSLQEITIPNTISLIDEGAFDDCTGLKTVYFNGIPAQWRRIIVRSGNEALKNARVVFPVQPGDVDSNGELTVDDAIYLLQHVLMPDMFPVGTNVNYDKKGVVDVDDAIYLLQHILMSELFPL